MSPIWGDIPESLNYTGGLKMLQCFKCLGTATNKNCTFNEIKKNILETI
jgi:hypothetical protein